MRSQDIEIPEPCHADWDAMRPEERGRFCFDCKKKVHDLSAMTKTEAREFLHRSASADVCVSYQHEEDGTLLFLEPVPRPAPNPRGEAAGIVPISRLRRPRSVVAAVAEVGMAVGMAAALAACAPHGEAPVRSYAAEASVFESPSVVIPVGEAAEASPASPATPQAPSEPPAVDDEPCEPEATEPPAAEPERPRVRGRIKRTAGKPMPRKAGGLTAFRDPLL